VWIKIMAGSKDYFLLESHYSRFTFEKGQIRKVVFSCMQQLIEPDTFSEMKIIQIFSLPDRNHLPGN